VNPAPQQRYDLVVLGGGTAGLTAARAACRFGAKVALVEERTLGGECLATGCVPSKALLRSARAVSAVAAAERFGVSVPPGALVDFDAVMQRTRTVRADISPHDAAEKAAQAGIDVFFGHGRFSGRGAVEVGAATLRFRKAIIAVGSRPALPSIEGLEHVGALDSDTVWRLTELPERLAVVGGGPVGCEIAQAFARLGSRVTLIHRHSHVLPRDDRDAARIAESALRRDGVALLLEADVVRVARDERGIRVDITRGARSKVVEADAVLVGVGRVASVEGLGLAEAGVRFEPSHIHVDDFLRTDNPSVFAAGDCCMRLKFTHAAGAAAGIAVRNALFFGRRRLSSLRIPWCTYIDPEVAHIGLTAEGAGAAGVDVDTYTKPFAEIDRALTDGESEGFCRIHTRAGKGSIVGATVVGAHAGEIIGEIATAMRAGLRLDQLTEIVRPYPTLSEAVGKCAAEYAWKRAESIAGITRRWFDLTQ
jgi:pyruvate/2-oxoglutarate dehydrogenase complex dihydrolipoamide dehydrogenase (E3) component